MCCVVVLLDVAHSYDFNVLKKHRKFEVSATVRLVG